jgi:hypothetical protein
MYQTMACTLMLHPADCHYHWTQFPISIKVGLEATHFHSMSAVGLDERVATGSWCGSELPMYIYIYICIHVSTVQYIGRIFDKRHVYTRVRVWPSTMTPHTTSMTDCQAESGAPARRRYRLLADPRPLQPQCRHRHRSTHTHTKAHRTHTHTHTRTHAPATHPPCHPPSHLPIYPPTPRHPHPAPQPKHTALP